MATSIRLDFLCPNAHLLIIDRLSKPSSTAMLKLWRSNLDGHVRKYRPEDHYMRGPGRCRTRSMILTTAFVQMPFVPTENGVLRGSVSFSLKHRTAASSQAGYDFLRCSAALRYGN